MIWRIGPPAGRLYRTSVQNGRLMVDTGAEVANLTLDLGIDVERRLSFGLAARVAGDHQLADLLA
jgi:hypothetical protein